nr:MAG TPA: hypothetical protein [Microviridae sp.]
MDIMITKFNLHLTMFHVKCKVRNSKNYICVSFHVEDKGYANGGSICR